MKEKNHFKLILFAKTEKSQVPKSDRFSIHFGIHFVIILGAFWHHFLIFFGIDFYIIFWMPFFLTLGAIWVPLDAVGCHLIDF